LTSLAAYEIATGPLDADVIRLIFLFIEGEFKFTEKCAILIYFERLIHH